MSGSCLDLRKYQDINAVQDAFSLLVSGKKGYKAVIERKIEPIKCSNCKTILDPIEKFCHECGTKVENQPTS